MYSIDQRQDILRLRFDRGSVSYEPRSKRGETRHNRGLNVARYMYMYTKTHNIPQIHCLPCLFV